MCPGVTKKQLAWGCRVAYLFREVNRQVTIALTEVRFCPIRKVPVDMQISVFHTEIV